MTFSPLSIHGFRKHQIIWIVIAVFVLLPTIIFTVSFTSYAIRRHEHASRYDELRKSIHGMLDQLPEGTTKKEWEFMIGYTEIALGNFCSTPVSILDEKHFLRFLRELNQKIQDKKFDVALIDWIWDELRVFSPMSQSYDDSFRPTRPERLQYADRTSLF